MAVGGCFCGNVRVEHHGQPLTTALCHCLDCRKLTGSLYTYSFIVKTAELEISGSPKAVAKISDSGNPIENYICPDCGTLLFGRKTNSNGDPDELTVLRAGIFDDMGMLNERKPEIEIYTDRRLNWVSPVEGARQFSGMLSLSSI
ncbi:uncharacterized protein N7479_008253 [Penicillium vulpinum]|uniref:uncharacterized protein n=1 Tax=Penicillium vulpinum TaxID=29845 RepID=UPI002548182A|nr:uncharacterized protein N7479_008253 [Penicillium vulpinum]KAJ5961103.1 hypothetical protein N7479_008253 [Penicillium vulpinum]